MEIWNYIKVLEKQQKGWFIKKDNTEERLTALSKIAELAYPSYIQHLTPYLKDNNKEIQQAVRKTIIHLFGKIKTQKGYYGALKHCKISKSDIDFYLKNFSIEECIILLVIASQNSSGYVREKAVKMLVETNNEFVIPFIVFRLADWVPAVREKALQGIEKFKKREFINALIDNLNIFEWLQKVERIDLSSVYSGIIKYVLVDNKDYVIKNYTSFSDKTRLLIAKEIANFEIIQSEELRLLLNDNHFLIRNLALFHFNKLSEDEISNLLKDKSARIRLQTLYRLKNRKDFNDIVFDFLADNSASIREFSRFTLKESISDFSKIYNENLNTKKNITGSLCGLAETNGANFIETIVPFLTDKNLRIRKSAFLAIKKIAPERAYTYALQNLNTEHSGIRNAIIDFVAKIATPEILQKARETYVAGSYDLKKSMLKLFSRIGKWATIADLMIGTIDEDENIRHLSVGYLNLWKKKATSFFIEPKQDELKRANDTFKFTFEMHEEKKYFDTNPLIGIDFYLR